MRFFSRTPCAVSTVILLLTSGALQAHAADVVSANGTLSQLSYKLTDLDLTDGVKASVTFGSPDSYNPGIELMVLDQNLGVPTQGNNAYVNGSLFNSGNAVASQPGIDATASKTGNSLSAQAKYSVSEAASVLNAPYAQTIDGGSLLFYERLADISPNGSLGGLSGETFTLAPHTSITFTGQYTGTANADLTSLLNSPAFLKAQAVNANIGVSVWTDGELHIQHPSWTSVDGSDENEIDSGFAQASSTLDSLGHVVSDNTQSQASKTLSVTFANTSNKAIDSVIYFEVRAEAYMHVQAVPEASTWAMASLGLVGLGAAVARARRRRSKA